MNASAENMCHNLGYKIFLMKLTKLLNVILLYFSTIFDIAMRCIYFGAKIMLVN